LPYPFQQRQFGLDIRAWDQATEIHVLDGRLRSVAQGRGSLSIQLDPGIYKIVGRCGDARFEVLASPKEGGKVVEIPKLEYSTPVPLEATRAFDPALARDVRELTGVERHDLAQGSSIFFCARDVRDPALLFHPMQGLSLCNAEGKKLLELRDVAKLKWPAWAARTISVKPGTYRLRLDLPSGAVLEQILVASKGWMTQVFLVCKAYGEEPESYRADLANASILLTLDQPNSFNPRDRDARLADLARQGLARGRQVLSDEVLREIIGGKFRDPMLGILGTHLLLLERLSEMKPNEEGDTVPVLRDHLDQRIRQLFGRGASFERLLANLRHLFQEPHPDVESLTLLLGVDGPSAHQFHSPPMLHQSWSLVVEATAKAPNLVPADSISAREATRVLNQNPWLLLGTPGRNAAKARDAQVSQFRRAVNMILEPPIPEARAPVAGAPPNALSNAAKDLSKVSEEKRRNLVRSLGLPISSIERLGKDLPAHD
jgi:hypothetical protein